MATLLSVLVAVGAILLALFVLPAPWGAVLVGGVIVWEIAEKLFWLRYSKRIPVAVGPEALIGLPVTAISACQPEGRVKLHGERWKARCRTGAELGETLVIEDIDRITLMSATQGHPSERSESRVSRPRGSSTWWPRPMTRLSRARSRSRPPPRRRTQTPLARGLLVCSSRPALLHAREDAHTHLTEQG